MEDMLKMMGIEAGSKSQGPKKQQNAIKAKKKDGVSDGSGMDSKVRQFKEKQAKEKFKKEKERKRAAAETLERHRGNKESMRAISRNLKTTKSADKSILAQTNEARERELERDKNGLRDQCDEDDYGYESRKQSSIYEKLIAGYEKNGEDPMDKFSKSKGKPREVTAKTLARVKEALTNPHFDADEAKRRKSREVAKVEKEKAAREAVLEEQREADRKKSRRQLEEEAARKRRMQMAAKHAPTATSFKDLMAMASGKKKVPKQESSSRGKAKILDAGKKDEDKSEARKAVREAEFERPMTKAQKAEYMREKASQMRRDGKDVPPELQSYLPPSKSSSLSKVPSKGASTSSSATPQHSESSKAPSPPRPPPKPVVKGPEFHTAVLKSKAFKERSSRELQEERGKRGEEARKRERPPAREERSSSSKRPRQRSVTPPRPGGSRNNRIESDDGDGYEDEDEYDSEMDDFIDDGGQMDVSAEIRKIMGYDRRKFVDEDDDCDNMEAGYSEVMREEIRSAKIGRMEDEEEERLQEEERRRKKEKKKAKEKEQRGRR